MKSEFPPPLNFLHILLKTNTNGAHVQNFIQIP